MPYPTSVRISFKIALGTLPSIMTAALDPELKVSKHVLILGIIPPVIILFLIIPSILFFERFEINFLFLSNTPATSVSNKILSAFNALAIAPAAVSALILNLIYFTLAVGIFYLAFFGARKKGTLINVGE